MDLVGQPDMKYNQLSQTKAPTEEEWQTVSFSRKRTISPRHRAESNHEAEGINVKIFNATTGKYLNTQKLKYVRKNLPAKTDTNKKRSQSHIRDSSHNHLENLNKFAELQTQPTVFDNTILCVGDGFPTDQCMASDLDPNKKTNSHVVSNHSQLLTDRKSVV